MLIRVRSLGDVIRTWDALGTNDLFIDTNTAEIQITKAFIGPLLVSQNGEQLGVWERDTGFELTYIVNGAETRVSLQEGKVKVLGTTP